MAGRIALPPTSEERNSAVLPLGVVSRLLDTIEEPLMVAERSGNLLLVNTRARQCLGFHGYAEIQGLNLFNDILQVDSKKIFGELERGQHEVNLNIEGGEKKSAARIQWMPEPDWLVVEIENKSEAHTGPDPATQLTVQELLQEREITYRNLLAAYLKLQEVNRQKTVFLASAAHELKTPLAVIKGYYDLLLAGSLGRLSENQRDCLDELAKRWSEAFQRKGVKLEASFDPSIPNFRFDYQKVQQAAANLLDNALKHTPTAGLVTLYAGPHFWERRVAEVAPIQERRRFRLPRPNSVEISVVDSGPGIAAEHHQEIFEDFVRVDRNTTGMGLGLAIAKRLIQAHRGKIWVESEPAGGSKFTFLLPMDQS